MKEWLIAVLKNDVFMIVVLALLLGFFLGTIYNSKFFIPVKIGLHNFYLKINPDSQKDSHTLIIENVTKDNYNISGKDIFEVPKKKENKFVIIIKRIFNNNSENKSKDNINDIVLD